MVLYQWERCSTCRATRDELTERGVAVEARDIFARPLDAGELTRLAARAGGIRSLVSTRSPSFRAFGRPLDGCSDEELRHLVVGEPRLLRRPILDTPDGALLVGARAIRSASG